MTNQEFSSFVSAPGYITVAERKLNPSLNPDLAPEHLNPGSAVFVTPTEAITAGTPFNWWHFIEGANWRHPDGPNSNIKNKQHYPVVHIFYEDAQAFAKWKGHRLPTEAEFEFASKGNLKNQTYAWGEKLLIDGKYQANIWQGGFPFHNSADDGFKGLAPVGCFAPNGYGIYDMTGNVWEWTSSPYFPSHQPKRQYAESVTNIGYDPRQPNAAVSVVKGGLYMCSPEFCFRYRPAARQGQDIGFRTVMSKIH